MIQIALLQHSRQYYPNLIKELNKLDKSIRDEIVLHFLVDGLFVHPSEFKPQFEYIVTHFANGLNYLQKLQVAVTQPYEYSIKLDDDIILTANTIENLFDSKKLLEDNLLTTPLLSSGIPTSDWFVSELLSDQYVEWCKLCASTPIPRAGVWPGYEGDEYLKLNKTRKWNYQEFYKDVDALNLYYKGIHPIRTSPALQNKLNEWILTPYTLSIFQSKSEYSPVELPGPYFCNSVFIIKTELWGQILRRYDLYVDAFDEVPLNRYAKETGLKMIGLRNCYAIHPYYNSVENHLELGKQFYEKYKEMACLST